jgi:hypothetical protein
VYRSHHLLPERTEGRLAEGEKTLCRFFGELYTVNGIIGCERSGVVREAFRAMGHEVYSNDLVPADDGSEFHIIGDAIEVARSRRWDFAIFHPPCTRLTVAGARWFKGREREQAEAIRFAEALWDTDIPHKALENPIGVLSTKSKLGKPTQIIQPWMFGHGEVKATCLWLDGFPALIPTQVVAGRVPRVHFESPGVVNGMTREQRRSITYTGIAEAMACQWSRHF